MKGPILPSCNVCGSTSGFVHQERMREGYICANCGASSRHRAVMYALGRCLSEGDLPTWSWRTNKDIVILESSGRGSYPMMLKEKFSYYNTEYDPDSDLMKVPYTRFADFQNLAYSDNEFDYVMATDVFEHIREDDKAFREIYRALKPQGTFIMTVPYNHNWEETLVRVNTAGERDIFVLPPEYHGGGGQTLTYRIYGRDLLHRLHGYGFTVAYFDLEIPKYGIVRQAVLVASKGCYVNISEIHAAHAENGKIGGKSIPLALFRLFVIFKYNALSVPHLFREFARKLSDSFAKLRKG